MNKQEISKKSGFNFEWHISDSESANPIDGYHEMRDWQIHAFEQLKSEQFMILNAPMGSGKSWLMCLLSTHKMREDSKLKTIIALPQSIIASGFMDEKMKMSDGERFHWQIKDSLNLCGDKFGEGTVNSFIRWLEKPLNVFSERTIICTHATVVLVYEKLKSENRLHLFNNILLWVDEAHHVKNAAVDSFDGVVVSNRIGELVVYFLDNYHKNLHLGLTTATFFRGDRASLLTDSMEEKFKKFNLPYDEYLKSMKHLKSFSFDFLLCGHNYIQGIEQLIKVSKKKDIVYIPSPNSRYSTGSKLQAVKDIMGIYGSITHSTKDGVTIVNSDDGERKILNLVDKEQRAQKKGYLDKPILKKESSALDVIIALGMFKEGANWIYANRSIIVGARASLVDVIQMIGRLFRDVENKSHVEVIQLLPFSLDQQDKESFRENLNNYLKAIYASLILENILNPIKIQPMQKLEKDENAEESAKKVDWLNKVIPDDTKQQALIEEVGNRLVNIMDQNKETINNTSLLRDEYNKIIPEILQEYEILDYKDEVSKQIWNTLIRRSMQMQGLSVENIDFDIVHEINPLGFMLLYTSGHCDVNTFAKLREAIQVSRVARKSFEDARNFVRSLGLKTWHNWTKWAQSSMRPKDIPSAPDKAYAGLGWIDWGDFLGTYTIASQKRKFRSFEEVKVFVQALDLKNEHEWRNWKKNNKLATDIPAKPERVYANSGWTGWGDFLGTYSIAPQKHKFRAFDEAKLYVRINTSNLKNKNDWALWAKTAARPKDIPADPQGVYANFGWIGWGDFLGTGNIASFRRNFRSFEDSRIFARRLLLKGKAGWFEWVKNGDLPIDIPIAPNSVYANKGWNGWKDWLGN